MMPHRIAIALQDDGWYVRSAIVWAKPNPMPESVRDRPTNAYEMIFLLTKKPRYFWDAEAIRTAYSPVTPIGGVYNGQAQKDYDANGVQNAPDVRRRAMAAAERNSGANARNVWTIPTQGRPDAHFATYPDELVKRCVLAGTSEKGVCAECGAPWGASIKALKSRVQRRMVRDYPSGERLAERKDADRAKRHELAGDDHDNPNPRLAPHLRPRRTNHTRNSPRPLRRQRNNPSRRSVTGPQLHRNRSQRRIPRNRQKTRRRRHVAADVKDCKHE